MGVTYDQAANFPDSTGAAEAPPESVTVTHTDDNTSTGAVEPPPASVTTEFGPTGQEATGAVPDPEPQTITIPSVKVVQAPPRQQPHGNTAAETRQAHRADTGQIPRQQPPQPDPAGR